MYELLKKMRDYYSEEEWLTPVNQAYNRSKITDEQYNELMPG